MHGTSDYSKLIGETGPIQYPAASLYIYSFFNWCTDYNITKDFMSNIHVLVDMLRMYLLVRIYKQAFGKNYDGKLYIFCLLLFQAKYKFIGITHQFNDCFMVLFALLAIHLN